MAQAAFEVWDLRVDKGGRTVLSVPHLSVGEGEVVGLVGPNGAGKTTLLLAMAGLDMSFRGRIVAAGVPLEPRGVLRHRRRLGMVFQDPQVLDATVLANVMAPLRFRGVPAAEARRRARRWLERLGIGDLADRRARTLSGGERQRLALARALVTEPEVLLLDEPFSSLDAPTRAALITDLRQLLSSLAITAVVVSHDFAEVFLLAERVVVLVDGQVRQEGSPREVFSRPADPEVARLVGMENVWPAEVLAGTRGPRLRLPGVEVDAAVSQPPGPVLAGVRPEAVVTGDGRGFPAQVRTVVPHGPLVRVEFGSPLSLVALVPPALAADLRPGCTVPVFIPPDSFHLFGAPPPGGGKGDYSPGT